MVCATRATEIKLPQYLPFPSTLMRFLLSARSGPVREDT